MFRLSELQNGRALVLVLGKMSGAVKEGASEVITETVQKGAELILAGTHSPTGRAARSVFWQMRTPLSGITGYDKREAWWMGIVDLSGAHPHPIFPRGLKGSANQKRLSRIFRKYGGRGLTINWATDFAGLGATDWHDTNKAGASGKARVALSFGGGHPLAHVMHPGMQPKHLLQNVYSRISGGVPGKVVMRVKEKMDV